LLSNLIHTTRVCIEEVEEIVPCGVASVEVCDYSSEYNSLLEALPFKHPERDVLHEGVHTYDDVWLVLHESCLHLPSELGKIANKLGLRFL